MNHRNRQGYFFIEALVSMMIVSLVLGGTMTSLSTASTISKQNSRQLTTLILCEELMENLRRQWFASSDPVTEILGQDDPNFGGVTVVRSAELDSPTNPSDWRQTRLRCPWPTAIDNLYSGQYKIQPVWAGTYGAQPKGVRIGTLFRLQVRVQATNQNETVSLETFLPLTGVPGGE